jgi:transcriptional regulator with XRE-family HTH domain
MTDYDTIRRRLRDRRYALGMSQRALAAELGTQQSHISELESAAYQANTGTLFRWAEALGFRLTIEERFR